MKNILLIVESPTKANTIKKFLKEGYSVLSSMGHIRDLPKNKLGVDVEKDFSPQYVIIPKKQKIIKEIKDVYKKVDKVILATDPDREGEAIAWHLALVLNMSLEEKNRIVFHEITSSAVLEAIKNPRRIDMCLVNAQQARRILDRLVGYKLSEFLWKKIRYGLSAGRVQSVAVRLIVEREREIESFKSKNFWRIFAYAGKKSVKNVNRVVFSEGDTDKNFIKNLDNSEDLWRFSLLSENGKTTLDTSEEETKVLIKELPGEISIVDVDESEKQIAPPPPLITSTLQRESFIRFGFSAYKTMRLAQDLYEAGLITYMRTDSVKLSDKAIDNIREWIKVNFGEAYLNALPRIYKTRQRLAQEAHEAIRPTDMSVEKVPDNFSSYHQRLYSLIRDRTIATQMTPAITKLFLVKANSANRTFLGKLTQLISPGFYRVLGVPSIYGIKKTFIPQKGDILSVNTWLGLEDHTKPPSRYTEASLVKSLEKYGIGRPSTYAPIIETIVKRGYVKREGRFLVPTDNGFVINDLLVKHFKNIVDIKFTSTIEEKLDEIAKGNENWVNVVSDFYTPFEKLLIEKEKAVKKEEATVLGESEEMCPICGAPMVIKIGKYGKFLSCSRFPECKGQKVLASKIDEKKYEIVEKCPTCGKRMVLRSGKFGTFWACENYPKCKTTMPMYLKEKCPECGASLVERKSKKGKKFVGCSNYPNCDYIKK